MSGSTSAIWYSSLHVTSSGLLSLSVLAVGITTPAAFVQIHQHGYNAWRLELRADEQEDGHDVPHQVVQKGGADEVEHVHVAVPARPIMVMMVGVVVANR
jgi:hypothetical protein